MSKNNFIIDSDTSFAWNRLAREQMKLKLLADIRTDLIICEIEGWSKTEYITELQSMLNAFLLES